jgi:hypothetical protein
MKNLFLFSVIVILSIACTTKEDKVKVLIKEYILQHIPEESYKPITFGKLDTAFSVIKNDSAYLSYKEKLDDVREGQRWALSPITLKTLSDEINALRDTMEQLEKNFQPKPIGWKIKHSFEVNLGSGLIYEKTTSDFYLNWEVDSVYYDIVNP